MRAANHLLLAVNWTDKDTFFTSHFSGLFPSYLDTALFTIPCRVLRCLFNQRVFCRPPRVCHSIRVLSCTKYTPCCSEFRRVDYFEGRCLVAFEIILIDWKKKERPHKLNLGRQDVGRCSQLARNVREQGHSIESAR